METRDKRIDALKGILISCVVIAHIGCLNFVYWFHMPLFFIVCGYFTKDINKREDLLVWIKKRCIHLMIPYCVYYIGIKLLTGRLFTREALEEFLMGGKHMTGLFGTWWFITVVLFSQILYTFIRFWVKNKYVIHYTMSIMYICGFVISGLLYGKGRQDILFNIPWNLDVVLIAIGYIHVGYLISSCKNCIKEDVNRKNIFFAVIALIGIVVLHLNGIEKIDFNMKSSLYGSNILYPVILPLIFGVILLAIIDMIPLFLENILSKLGKASLYIMFIHPTIVYVIKTKLMMEGYISVVTVYSLSVISGLLLLLVAEKNKYFRILLG